MIKKQSDFKNLDINLIILIKFTTFIFTILYIIYYIK